MIGFYGCDENSFLQKTLYVLSTAGYTAAVFQFLAKSSAFYEVIENAISNTLEKTGQEDMLNSIANRAVKNFSLTHKYFKTLNEKEIDKLCNEINKFQYIKVENDYKRVLSIKLAEEYIKTRKKELEQKKEEGIELNEFEELELKWANRNHIALENTQTRTITKDGTEIIMMEDFVKVLKNGTCTFSYIKTFRIPNPHVLDSDFKECRDGNRFSKCSYSAKVIDYYKTNRKKRTVEPNVMLEKITHEDSDAVKITVTIDDCKKGETFKLLYSLTVPKEYSKENLEQIKNNPQLLPSTNYLSTIPIRRIIFQEEIYNNVQQSIKLDPSMKLYKNVNDKLNQGDSERVDPNCITENLFYKQYRWDIYFSDYNHGTFVFTPFKYS